MSGDNLEGQISFLGLLEGYTDKLEEVKKPAPPKRVKPVLPKAPEQFKLEFIDLDAEAEAEHLEVSAPKREEEPVKDEVPTRKEKASKAKSTGIDLYKDCAKCWCHDCKHNSRGEGVPREMCGAKIPCPACDGCVEEGKASICEIGNPTEGCKLRAIEEGIVEIEEG